MADLPYALEVNNVSKNFRLPHEKTSSIKHSLINLLKQKRSFELQTAVKDVSFAVKKGEFFGIVGRNGSGKSTLLKLIAGIYSPTKGQIHTRGLLTPFIELGVGFNPELTGRENVFLNGALLGFNRQEMNERYQEIVDFAELERFMDQKLKNYSSGMQVRLAFSIAIRAKSDILLIDEVLAVGDAAFQAKCFEYFRVLKKQSKTVVFVSHDRGAIDNFCDRCLLIDQGEIQVIGSPNKVLRAYNDITLEQIGGHEAEAPTDDEDEKTTKRVITRDIVITNAKIKKDGKVSNKFLPKDKIVVEVEMKANKQVVDPVCGIVIQRKGDPPVLTTNTKVEKIKTGTIKKGEKLAIVYEVDNIFGNGAYTVSPAVASKDTEVFYDWKEGLLTFYSNGWDDTYTSIHPAHTIKLKRKS